MRLTSLPTSVAADPAATRYRFGPTSTVRIDGVGFVPVAADEDGHVFRRADDPAAPVEGLTHSELNALVEGRRVEEDEAGLSAARTALRMAEPVRHLGDLPPDELRTVLFREHMCRGFMRLEVEGDATRSDASMSRAIPGIYADYVAREIARQTVDGRCGTSVVLLNKPSPTALRRWLRRYERYAFQTLALRPGYSGSGNTTPRLSPDERRILQRYADRYASRRRPTIASLLLEMRAVVDRINRIRKARGIDPLRCPGKTAMTNAIARLDQFFVYAGREGADAARRRFAIVKGGLDVLLPLERVEIDECKVPLQTLLEDLGVWKLLLDPARERVEKSRLWITTAIDTRTRCYLAVRLIEAPSAATAMATLEMAVSDKTEIALAAGCRTPWDMHGGIDTVVVDAGPGFVSEAFVACVADLGSELLRPPVKKPWLRGRKERSYGTIHTGLLSMLDGRSFENPVVKGDYDSEGNAAFDAASLGRQIVRWIVDVYHNRPHSGLGGQTPRNAWLELRRRFGVRLPPSAEERRHIFGTLLKRRITNGGVRWMGLRYQSPELQKLRCGRVRTDVLIRVDPLDLGTISVRTPVGRLSVRCTSPGMDGVTLEHWMMTTAHLRRRFKTEADADEAVVLEAIRDIRASAEGARRRAGIASPILDFDDYERVERSFSGFERCDAEADDEVFGPPHLPIEPAAEEQPNDRTSDGPDRAADPPSGSDPASGAGTDEGTAGPGGENWAQHEDCLED